MRIEFRVPRQEVIGPNNGRVAAYIAATNVAFFQHGNALEPMFFCQVVSSRQPMSTATNDHNVISLRWLWIAPMRPPTPVTGQALSQDFQS